MGSRLHRCTIVETEERKRRKEKGALSSLVQKRGNRVDFMLEKLENVNRVRRKPGNAKTQVKRRNLMNTGEWMDRNTIIVELNSTIMV